MESQKNETLDKKPMNNQGISTKVSDYYLALQSELNRCEALLKSDPTLFSSVIKCHSQLSTLEQFAKYPLEFQARSVEALQFYIDSLSEMKKNLESPKSSKLFLWRALQQLKLIPPDDLLEKIGDDEIIEIYSSQGVQMFRSFSLLEVISYAIEDLVVFSWDGLFYRDPKLTESLMQQAGKLFSKQISTTQKNEIEGKHVVRETQSEEKKKFEIEFGVVAPLKTKNYSDISYFVSTIKTLKVLND